MTPEELQRLADRIRANLVRLQNESMVDLARVYRSNIKQFDSDIELLSSKIAEGATKADIQKLREYNRLIKESTQALADYQAYMTLNLRNEADRFIKLGIEDARILLDGQLAVFGLTFNMLRPEQLAALGDYILPGRPLYKRLQLLAPSTVDGVVQSIFDLVGKGFNPTVIARRITNAFGMGLSDSMRMMRTVQIYSYRDASHLNYQNNRDVVDGWIWYAKLDGLTCMSCVAMHGTFHSVDERLNDHHNGRCVAVPVTRLSDPFIKEGDGKSWFEQQPEAVQKQMMGAGKYDAWKAGKFDFNQLSAIHKNDVFGDMRGEATLKSLLGGNSEFDLSGIDMNNIKSYDDWSKVFNNAVQGGNYDVLMGDGKYTNLQRVKIGNSYVYFDSASKKGAEMLSSDIAAFKRNNGDDVFNKMFANTQELVITGKQSAETAVAWNNGMSIFNSGNGFNYETLIHELGHNATANSTKIINDFYELTQKGLLSPTSYGQTKVFEDVAESFRLFFMEPKKMMYDYQERYQLIRSFLYD